MQALRPAPGPYRFHLGIGIYGALHAPKPPEQGKIPSYNSLCRALRPVSDPYSRFHLGVGHYGALHTPKPPWFLSGERKEPKLAGETPAPLSVRHNRHARKIFLRGSPHLERKIFPLRGFPRGAVRSLFFLVTTLGTGGVLRGNRLALCRELCLFPLKHAFGSRAFFVQKGAWPGVRGLEAPEIKVLRGGSPEGYRAWGAREPRST